MSVTVKTRAWLHVNDVAMGTLVEQMHTALNQIERDVRTLAVRGDKATKAALDIYRMRMRALMPLLIVIGNRIDGRVDAYDPVPSHKVDNGGLMRVRAALEARFQQIAPDLAQAGDPDADEVASIDPADLRDFFYGSALDSDDPEANRLWKDMTDNERHAFLMTVWPNGPAISLE